MEFNHNLLAGAESSGFCIALLGADLAYPGNRNAQLLAVAGNLTVDLASGRIPVGTIPDLATAGSALQSYKLASFSELTNFRAAWQGTEHLPVSVGAHGSSLITNAIGALQLSATAQTATANFESILENVSSSWAGGGFFLYPNKANTNTMQSVYAK